jgi:hypothetical protein
MWEKESAKVLDRVGAAATSIDSARSTMAPAP